MSTVQRFDFSPVKKAILTDEGYLIDEPIVARTGIQVYMDGAGNKRRELRLPEDVFHPDSLATYENKPITDDHPTEKVDATNFKKYAIGFMKTPGWQDGENVRVKVAMLDADVIDKAVKGGKNQLSLGYTVDLEEAPGVHPVYGEYDAIQRNPRINHLSLVPKGRAGNARLNLDRSDAVSIETKEQPMTENVKLSQVKLDTGLSYDAAPEVVQAYEQARKDNADLVSKLDAETKRADTAEGERDTYKAEIEKHDEALKKVKADALEEARKEVAERADAEKVAEAFKVDCKDLTTRQIKEAVIKAVRKDADLEGKSDEYVDAAYDVASAFKGNAAMADQRKATAKREDGGEKPLTAKSRYEQFKADGFKVVSKESA